MKQIQTVTGPISAEQLGKTMMHEHCLVQQPQAYRSVNDIDPSYAAFLDSKITPQNRSKVYFHMHKHNDNLDLTDESLIIKELQYYKQAGGDTVVDVTTPGIGRDVAALQRISRATGVQIVACTGLYIGDSVPEPYRSMEKAKLVDFFMDELENGIGSERIKPGYIGEIGMSDDWTPHEVTVLRAAGIACRESGIAMTVHMPIFKTWGERIVDILQDEGTDLDRVVLSHCDPTLSDLDYHLCLLERGVRLQFDQFGLEFPCTYGPYEKRWLPRDIERIRHIKRLCDMGWAERITVSHDMCFKSLYRTYGGPGISHILENLAPYFLFEGISEKHMHQILVENPKTILTPGR